MCTLVKTEILDNVANILNQTPIPLALIVTKRLFQIKNINFHLCHILHLLLDEQYFKLN